MSTVKFVYKSQNIPDTLPIEGSTKTITSGGVYEAISKFQMNTLFKSGYLPEGIAAVVPQHTLNFANGTLTLKAGSKAFIPNGFDENSKFKFTTVTIPRDISKSSTFSGNMDAFVFVNTNPYELICRTKRSNTISSVTGEPLDSVVQQVWAQGTEPAVAQSATSDGVIWWDTTENKIKVFSDEAGTFVEAPGYAIPLGLVSSSNNKITRLIQDFLMSGFVGNMVWLNPGVTLIAPTGIKPEDSTFVNEMMEVTSVIADDVINPNGEVFKDYGLYLNTDGEIEGPVDEYAFDNNKGLFVDSDGGYHEACRFALISAGHLTTNGRDPLTVTAFATRPTLALADNDDIEYLMRLIGSSVGLTIDDLEREIQEASADRAYLREQIKAWLSNLSDTLKDDLHHSITHKQMPVKKVFKNTDNVPFDYVVSGNNVGFYRATETNPLEFVKLTLVSGTQYKDENNKLYTLVTTEQTPTVLNPDVVVDELIKGNKTFQNAINGTLNGTAKNVRITKGGADTELIPLCYSEYSTVNDTNIVAANTTVRIKKNSVKATKFEGTCTEAYWADLAEMYETDAEYGVGTLLKWGGEKELTLANMGVANAVVSEKPAFLMNAEGVGQPIALAGRVKVRVLGKVKKHDAIVLNEMAPGVGKVQENASEVIVARALEDNDFVGEKLVLCVVRFSL